MRRIILALSWCLLSISAFSQAAYRLHQKIQVKWQGSWWPAEVIEIKDNQYKIHYDNYSSNWDEWVGTDRMQATTNQRATNSNNGSTATTDGKFSVGDKVEAWSAGKWYPASIVSIGSGNYKGYYYVHFSEYSDASNQWLNASSVRKVTATANTANITPRDGKYKILAYGNPNNPIYMGYFTLKSGSYSYYDAANRLIGSGTYSYNNASKTVKWNSGPFKTNQWDGPFEVSREGKTHTIRLHGVTIGTNSTDAN